MPGSFNDLSKLNSFRIRLLMFHSTGPGVIPLELDLCKINPEPLVFWGKFCQVWISGIESSEQEHFLSRIRDVDSAIASLNSLGFTIYISGSIQNSFCLMTKLCCRLNFTTLLSSNLTCSVSKDISRIWTPRNTRLHCRIRNCQRCSCSICREQGPR